MDRYEISKAREHSRSTLHAHTIARNTPRRHLSYPSMTEGTTSTLPVCVSGGTVCCHLIHVGYTYRSCMDSSGLMYKRLYTTCLLSATWTQFRRLMAPAEVMGRHRGDGYEGVWTTGARRSIPMVDPMQREAARATFWSRLFHFGGGAEAPR